jgi:hypothetical protein
MADQCCCGRIKPAPSEPERINEIVHEAYGTEGAFCGPWWKHELRDLHAALTAMERERDEARARCVAIREALVDCAANYTVGDQTGIKWEQLAREFYRRMKVADEALADTGDMAGMVVVPRELLERVRNASGHGLDAAARGDVAAMREATKQRADAELEIWQLLAASTGESADG